MTGSTGSGSHPSHLLPDFSPPEGAGIDILTAMETVFPSVVVPRLGEHLPSGLNSPASRLGSSSQRRMMYRAREQDITLSMPVGLGSIGYEMFDEDVQISLHSDPISDADHSRAVWNNDYGDTGEFGQVFRSISQEAGRSDSSRGEVPSVDRVAHVPLPIEAIELEHVPADPLPAAQDSAAAAGPGPSTSTGINGQRGKNRGPRGVTTVRGRRKGRGENIVLVQTDAVTELSPNEIRERLNDTTDIVLPSLERRQSASKRRSSSSASIRFSLPGFLSTLSDRITDLWKDVTLDQIPAMQPQSPRDRAQQRSEHVSHQTPVAEVEHEDVKTSQPMLVQRTAAPLPAEDVPMIEENEPMVFPEVQQAATAPGDKSVSSAEVQRAGAPAPQQAADQISIPSNSAGGPSISVSRSGSGLPSSREDRLHRDQVLDQVCACELALKTLLGPQAGNFIFASTNDSSRMRCIVPV